MNKATDKPDKMATHANYCLKSWNEFTQLSSQEIENIKELERVINANNISKIDGT